MADLGFSLENEVRVQGIRETDLNGEMISGAINTNTTTSIDLGEDNSQNLPHMDEMLKVATDLQSSGEYNSRPYAGEQKGDVRSPMLEFEHTGPATHVPPNVAETGAAPWQSSGGYVPPGSHPGQYDQNSHPGGNSAVVRPSTAQKIDHLKKWSISTYKCTRQYLSEKFGKGTKTVDTELETQIQVLRETQLRYINLLKLARQMMHHFQNMVQTQKNLGDSLADLGMKSPELQDEFTYNADAQKTLVKNGEILLGALQFFTSNLTTLCHKTMDDSIVTVKAYEAARIEYDAYRTDMEAVLSTPRTQATAARAEDTRLEYEQQKQRFDRLRNDLAIKLKFLEENKVKVMHKQLLLFHNAITAYFSGNKQALENCIQEFHIKMKSKESTQSPGSSFLEH